MAGLAASTSTPSSLLVGRGFLMPNGGPVASVSCPLLLPLQPLPLRPLLYRVSGRAGKRPAILDTNRRGRMLDKLIAALAKAVENALVRIADKKIPDNIADQFIDRGLEVLGELGDRAAGTVETSTDRIAGAVEAEVNTFGQEMRNVLGANPLDFIGKLFNFKR